MEAKAIKERLKVAWYEPNNWLKRRSRIIRRKLLLLLNMLVSFENVRLRLNKIEIVVSNEIIILSGSSS
ncbi:hypothetical protein KBD45_03955 [Candidatus Dojkabacteria bacterium]|nr:hypothetical protein [Candidatus Dojkabacteria bacterium]